eukprot:10710564-Ditylum_brightwellii.AAC.1
MTMTSQSKTLIVCDIQPDVIRRLPDPTQRRKCIDLVGIAIEAARRGERKMQCQHADGCSHNIIYTQLKFRGEDGYQQVNPNHPRLGVLRRLGTKNPNMRWFTTDELLVAPQQVDDKEKDGSKEEEEIVVPRTTYLPHGSDVDLMDVLKRCCDENSGVTLVGYGPTVQAICHILGDILCIPNVQVLRECIADESEARRDAMLEHGLLFDERVVSLTDFLEEYDCLHDRIDPGAVASADPAPKYVCDAKRGGHLCLFLPYLTRDYGYAEWPVQTWYQEGGSAAFT